MSDHAERDRVYRSVLVALCEQAGGEMAIEVPRYTEGGNLMYKLEPIDDDKIRVRMRFIPESSGSQTQ